MDACSAKLVLKGLEMESMTCEHAGSVGREMFFCSGLRFQDDRAIDGLLDLVTKDCHGQRRTLIPPGQA
jgi:hypothetical protein